VRNISLAYERTNGVQMRSAQLAAACFQGRPPDATFAVARYRGRQGTSYAGIACEFCRYDAVTA
jgi:hypothetical protein